MRSRRAMLCALAVMAPSTAFAQPEPGEPAPEPIAAPIATPIAAPAPAAVVATPAPPPAKSDDLDLSALDLDPTRTDEHLNIYGYADVAFRQLLEKASSFAANVFPKESTFLVGNVNLYFAKNLSRRWRSLLEVRFLYAPGGATNADGTLTHASAPDPADLQRPTDWGGVAIERVYLEYELSQSLTIQAGCFLTPYGIWNVDHGSPAIIPVSRPYISGEDLFPEQQTGLHLYGKHPVGDYVIGYHATLTNGRGPFQAFRDLDNNKAIGGRLELETRWLDGVQLGISAYGGRFTDRPADVLAANAKGELINTTPPGVAYDEVAWAADLRLHRGALFVQAEAIGNARHYLQGNRDLTRGGFVADGQELGAYALAGYRFDRFWQVMPFAVLEIDRERPTASLGDKAILLQGTLGLNFRPIPSVVLKLQYSRVEISAPLADFGFHALQAQAAWAF